MVVDLIFSLFQSRRSTHSRHSQIAHILKNKTDYFLSHLSSQFSPLSSLFSLYVMAKSAEDVHEREGENGGEEIQRLRKSLEIGGEERREGRERKRVEARFPPPHRARPHVRERGRRERGTRDE